MTVSLMQGAFIPEEIVKYTALINNESSHDIHGLTVKFKRVYTFTATSPNEETRENQVTLYQKHHNERVLRLSKRIIEDFFEMPFTPISTMDEDSIINVSYYLEFELETGSCHSNMELSLDIVVGSIGFEDSDDEDGEEEDYVDDDEEEEDDVSENNVMVQPSAPSSKNLDSAYNQPNAGGWSLPSLPSATVPPIIVTPSNDVTPLYPNYGMRKTFFL